MKAICKFKIQSINKFSLFDSKQGRFFSSGLKNLQKLFPSNLKISESKDLLDFSFYGKLASYENQKYTVNNELKENNSQEFINFSDLIDKYLLSARSKIESLRENKDSKDINNMISADIEEFIFKISKEELFRTQTNQVKLKESLTGFINGCIKYNKIKYLNSSYFFKNENYRQKLSNNNLESQYQKQNPFAFKNHLLSDLSIKRKYEELLGDNKSLETVPQQVLENHDNTLYQYQNFLASLKSVKQSYDFQKNLQKNTQLINGSKQEKLLTSYETDSLQPNKITEELFLHEVFKLKNYSLLKLESLSDSQKEEVEKCEIILKQENLKPYPGNDKGPNPEDDINHFYSWFRTNHDQEIVDAYDKLWRIKALSLKSSTSSVDMNNDDDSKSKEFFENQSGNKFKKFNRNQKVEYLPHEDCGDGLPNRMDVTHTDAHITDDNDPYFHTPDDDFVFGHLFPEDEEELKENIIAKYNTSLYNLNNVCKFPPKAHLIFSKLESNVWNWNDLLGSSLSSKPVTITPISNADEVRFLNEVHEAYTKKFLSKSLYSMIELYPLVSKRNVLVKNLIQLFENKPFWELTHKHFLLDLFASTALPLSEKETRVRKEIVKGFYKIPRTWRNARILYLCRWEKIDEQGIAEYDSEEETEESLWARLKNKFDEDKEEEERQEAKKKEAAEKREMEDAKNAGKEIFEAYKKKKEEEAKLKEKEEQKKEEEAAMYETSENNSDDEDEMDDRIEMEINKEFREKKEDSEEKKRIDKMSLDSKGRLILAEDEFDYNYFAPNEHILGENNLKKNLIPDGLPTLYANSFETDPKRLRYIELYKKIQKLLISKEELNEFYNILKLKETNPAMYSYITGIPLSEIEKVKLQRATFTDTYFASGTKLNLSEAELKLIETEVEGVKNKLDKGDEKESDIIEKGTQSMIRPIHDPTTPLSPYYQDIPIDYYDNEDGFWDDYIKEKHSHFDVRNVHYRPFHSYQDVLKKKI